MSRIYYVNLEKHELIESELQYGEKEVEIRRFNFYDGYKEAEELRERIVATMGDIKFLDIEFLLNMFSKEDFDLNEKYCDFFEDWCKKHDIEIFYGKKAFMNVYENFFIVNNREVVFV